MPYKYISSSGRKYNLYYSKVRLRGGKQATIYFLLPEDKEPNNRNGKSYLAETLPRSYEIKEIGINKTPMLNKVRPDYE